MCKIIRSYLSWVLVIVIMASIFPIVPQRAMAAEHLQLKTATQGEVVVYGGMHWILLDPSTGYVLYRDYGKDKAFQNRFDPDVSNNIGYWLNDEEGEEGFLKELMENSADLEWIKDHDWTTDALDKVSSNTTHKIGLLSKLEYDNYKTITIVNTGQPWWLRTYNGNDNKALAAMVEPSPAGAMEYVSKAYNSSETHDVRPAIYLNPNLFMAFARNETNPIPYKIYTLNDLGTELDPYIIYTADDLSAIRNNLSAHYELGANIDLADYDYGDGGGWMPIGTNADPFKGSLDGKGFAIINMTIDRPAMLDVGLIGYQDDANLSNIRLIDVNVIGSGSVGSLAGNSLAGTIEHSYATGRVNAEGNNAGGLVGENTRGTISNSYAIVDVSGWSRIGGLVGTHHGNSSGNSTIKNSYAAGRVHAYDSEVGGLVGYFDASGGNSIIENSYAVGRVTVDGTSGVGGLTGNHTGGSDLQVVNSFWNTETTGQPSSAFGEGLTTESMKLENKFVNWDTTIWGFRPGDTFPYLRSFPMAFGVDPLASTTYSLYPGQDTLSVTGSVYHDSEAEPIKIIYVLRHSTGIETPVTTSMITSSDGELAFKHKFPLTGYIDGRYTLSITASDDNHNVVGAQLGFSIDHTATPPPLIAFGTNGQETLARSASTIVTVSDNGDGVNPTSLQYAWSDSDVTPGSDTIWTSFASGEKLSIASMYGDYYLHIRASDSSDRMSNMVSNRFRLGSSPATLPVLTASTGAIIDVNGVSLNPTAVDTSKPSITLEVTPKEGKAYVTIPASVLMNLANRNEAFLIEIQTPYGSYRVPVNLSALIPGLQDWLTANQLKADDISFRINLIDKSDDEDIRSAFASGLPYGKTIGAIVDFEIEIVNMKTGRTIDYANQFNQALTRIIPMPGNISTMPALWGAFRYNEMVKQFEYVPATTVHIDGLWYVMIQSYSNSVYVVADHHVNFSDIQQHWSKPFVELAAAKGLVKGVGGDNYAPNQAVTRAEFAAMLVRAIGRSSISDHEAVPYVDMKSDAWYAEEVTVARELGLLRFESSTSFKPENPLTREEMASMLVAAIQLVQTSIVNEKVSLNGYLDIGSLNPTYVEDVQLAVQLGIMRGTSDNTFDPKSTTTRAQAATVFIQMLRVLAMID